MEARALGLAVALCLLGCAEAPEADLYTVRDSAGVTIVESRAPQWTEVTAWRLGDLPLVTIGLGADPDQQLFDVVGVDLLSNGMIVVANAGTQEIRVYSVDGDLVESFGGGGEGPGEFTSLASVHVAAGDTIVALNQVPLRVGRYTLEDGLVSERHLGYDRERPWIDAYPLGLVSDGHHLLVYTYTDYFQPQYRDGYYHEPLPWGVLDLREGSVRPGGYFPGFETVLERTERGVRQMLVPFSHSGDITTSRRDVFVMPNDSYRVQKYDVDGSLLSEIRYDAPARPVPPTAVAQWIDARLSGAGPADDPRVVEARRAFEALPVPETLPMLAGIEVDDPGNVWVREFDWPRSDSLRFAVFGTQGALLGWVRAPEGLDAANSTEAKPMRIGGDYVLGVWRDELDVEQVRLYRLTKPAA